MDYRRKLPLLLRLAAAFKRARENRPPWTFSVQNPP